MVEDLANGGSKVTKSVLPGFILATLDDSLWWEFWSAQLAEKLQSSYLATAEKGKEFVERQLKMKVSWNYLQPAVKEWASANAAALVSQVGRDVKESIRGSVLDGISSGKTVYQIRDEIAGLKDDENNAVFPEWRATRIARTEVIRAHSQGAAIGYEKSGVVRGMRWMDGQSGACPKCRELNNKVVKLGEKFYFDPKFGDGLPPRHPHCRCAISPVTVNQAKDLPADHPLRDDKRNSVEELTDRDTYTEISGVRVTGERKRHWELRHPETKEYSGLIASSLFSQSFARAKNETKEVYVDLHRVSEKSGKPLYLKVIVKMGESPFILTSYITTQK